MTGARTAISEEVRRLKANGFGREAIARRLDGVSERQVRRLLTELGLAGRNAGQWNEERPDLAPDAHKGSYTADDYLRDHAGEMDAERLAREVGRGRSVHAVRVRLSRLGLCISELRTDLPIATAAALVGWSEDWLLGRVRRKELRAHESGGVWRIWPSSLRDWVVADVTRVRWERVGREYLLDLAGLLTGAWGLSDDAVKARRRAAREGEATPLGPSTPGGG